MTPTLFGRWQTRILLLATVGVLITLPFFVGILGSGASGAYFWIVLYVAVLGLGWDLLYDRLQKFRWDRDWPAAFQLLAGIWEGIFLFILLKTVSLPGISQEIAFTDFAFHYSLVWLGVFTISQTLMRLIFLRWRFRGGQWL